MKASSMGRSPFLMSEGPSQPKASCAAFLANLSTKFANEAKGESATTQGATPLEENPVFFAPANARTAPPTTRPRSGATSSIESHAMTYNACSRGVVNENATEDATLHPTLPVDPT